MDIFDRAKAEETLTIGQKIRQLYAADLQFDSRANPPVKLSVLLGGVVLHVREGDIVYCWWPLNYGN